MGPEIKRARNILILVGQSKLMKCSFLQLLTAGIFLGLVGCATKPNSPPGAVPPPGPGITTAPATISSAVTAETLPPGEFAVLVESVPNGATVVVNGIPVGTAPQRVFLPGTAHGFFRDQVSLKVRFIAADAGHQSKTVEELLTPLDRIPASVKFTPTGTTRVPR